MQIEQTEAAMTGWNHHERAARMARYGHRCWIVWKDADGTRSERATVDSLERAMAAVGPDGKFSGYMRSTGEGCVLRRGVALAWLSNARMGLLNA